MSIFNFWVESTLLSLIGIRILYKCDLSPGTNVHEFQSERHATDNLKHLLNSNTCIHAQILMKIVILPHKH